MADDAIIISKAELDDIIEKAVERGVTATLTQLGFDHSNPLEVQADMQFLRSWRKASAQVGLNAIMTGLSIVVAGVLGLIWVSVKG